MSDRASDTAPDQDPRGHDTSDPSALATRLRMEHFPGEGSTPGGGTLHGHATTDQTAEQSENRMLRSRIQELEAQLAQRDRRAEQRDAATQTIDRETEHFLSRLGATVTARTIVLLKLGQRESSGDSTSQEPARSTRSVFDAPMQHEQAVKYARKLEALNVLSADGAIAIKICRKCNKTKFHNRAIEPPKQDSPWRSTLYTLNEFHPRLGKAQCCSKSVCMDCLFEAITTSIVKDWWFNLDQPRWLRCPKCPAALPLEDDAEVANTLRYMSGTDPQEYRAQFKRAARLRSALQSLPEPPTPEAVDLSVKLHRDLEQHGRLQFFDLQQDVSGLEVQMLPVASERHGHPDPLPVPVFTSLLVRGGVEPRECVICAEVFPDVTDGTPEDEEAWSRAAGDFDGEFRWRLRPFPAPRLLPECAARHALDCCRACVDRHVAAALEAGGVAACDRLACPVPGCGHVYTDAQLRALASPETFERCDRLRLLKALSAMPNFRWCLAAGCGSGEIYDRPEEPAGGEGPAHRRSSRSRNHNRIACSACGFVMCFAHQVPWHAGLSCAAYDRRQQNGGEGPSSSSSSAAAAAAAAADEVATRAWLEEHAKPCPGCGAPVEKRGGCFHMTCAACRFEFCWLCLADWGGIQPPLPGGPAGYNRLGHGAGCFFRRAGAPLPTMVQDEDLVEMMGGAGGV